MCRGDKLQSWPATYLTEDLLTLWNGVMILENTATFTLYTYAIEWKKFTCDVFHRKCHGFWQYNCGNNQLEHMLLPVTCTELLQEEAMLLTVHSAVNHHSESFNVHIHSSALLGRTSSLVQWTHYLCSQHGSLLAVVLSVSSLWWSLHVLHAKFHQAFPMFRIVSAVV